MDSRQHKFLSIAIVCILLATAVCVVYAYASTPQSDTPKTFTLRTTGYDSFGNCTTDIYSDELFSCGYNIGDFVILHWEDKKIRAFISENNHGNLVFEEFLDVRPDGSVKIGCFCAVSPIKAGVDVTVEFSGSSNREVLMPYYYKGELKVRESLTIEERMNYRCVSYGDIAENRLYRSINAFPKTTDVYYDYMNALVARHDADYVIDMYESVSDLEELRESGSIDEDNIAWYLDNDKLYAESMTILIIQSKDYAEIFQQIADNEGPYLIFCQRGKDRTGFVLMVLEALMGATYDEIYEDYCATYVNLYGTEVGSDEYKLYTVLVNPQLRCIHDPSIMSHIQDMDITSDITKYDLKKDAENYLKDYLGLSEETVEKIRHNLSAEA